MRIYNLLDESVVLNLKKNFILVLTTLLMITLLSSCSVKRDDSVDTGISSNTIQITSIQSMTTGIISSFSSHTNKEDAVTVIDEAGDIEPEESHNENGKPTLYPQISVIADFVIELYNTPEFPKYEFNDESVIVIELMDYNYDNIDDALISAFNGKGNSYYLISNINDPQIEFSFSSFDEACIMFDQLQQQIVVKYTNNYGLISNATSESNYVFLSDKIREIRHVHYEGSSKAEEFHIINNGVEIACNENDINMSIAEIEQNLYKYTELKTYRIVVSKGVITNVEDITNH